jgi:uncharacterized protein YjdB
MLMTTIVYAQPTHSSGMSVGGATGAESTEQAHYGDNSYKITGDGSNSDGSDNISITITIDGITDWTTITKVSLWIRTSGSWGGQYFVNSSDPGWKSSGITQPPANVWTKATYDFSATPFDGAAGWGQFGMQLWNYSEVLYLDEITFYNASGDVVYVIDDTDVSPPPTDITLTPGTINAITNKKQAVTVITAPTNASYKVSYSNDNETAATISDGTVTTLSAGIANITLTSLDAPSVSGTTVVTVSNPDLANMTMYANFENGLGNYKEVWESWNTGTNANGPAPIVSIVDNPQTSGNSSAKVLQVVDWYQWGAIVFKEFDMNKINTIKFKAFSSVEKTDMQFKLGYNNGNTPKFTNPVATLMANTWTEFSFDVTHLESIDNVFFIQLAAEGSQESTGTAYTLLIDSLIYITGDGSTYVPLTGIDISTTSISTPNGVLNLAATSTPATASNQKLTWSLVNASATIGDTAIFDADAATLTAVRNGTVTVKAVSTDGGFVSQKVVTITNQLIKPTALVIKDTALTINNLPVQMTIASSEPVDADKSVTWSIEGVDADTATITADGLLTPIRNGKVIVKATSAATGITLSVTKEITITGQIVEVTAVTITSANSISIDGDSLLLTAVASPADAADKTLVWSIQGTGTQIATLIGNVLHATGNGKLTVRAASVPDLTVYDEMEITISKQIIVPSLIFVAGADDSTKITTNFGSLQMFATVSPTYAEPSVTWSIAQEDSTLATISATGLLQAFKNGVVNVIATSTLDATKKGETEITVTNQTGAPLIIEVKGADNLTEITTSFGTLQMFATVSPTYAEPNVTWSVAEADSEYASISATGLLTAKADGLVTVIATSTADVNINGQAKITISGQLIPDILVTDITITAAGDVNEITTLGGTLQLTAIVNPVDATDSTVSWSIDDELIATVSELGLVTAIADGVVTVTAAANDSSGVTGTIELTISNQEIGISSNALNTLYVYPNPVTNTLSITNLKQASKIEIINSNGSVVTVTNEFNTKNAIDVQMLKSGVYVIRAIANETIYQGVFIKE